MDKMIDLEIQIGRGIYWWRVKDNILYVMDINTKKFVPHPRAKEYEKSFKGKSEEEIVKIIDESLKKEAESLKEKYGTMLKKLGFDINRGGVRILKVKYL